MAIPAAQSNVSALSLQDRLTIVIKRAAAQLPGDVGRQLLALIEPKSLAIMAAVVAVWGAAQFFGVGEVADVILLVVGWAALGGAAISGGKELVAFAVKTAKASSDDDLNQAATHLSHAIAILGVQTVLALLTRKPSGVLKDEYIGQISPSEFDNLPSNRPWGYKPSSTGDASMAAGEGATDLVTGDARYSLRGTLQDQQLAKAHESVHQFLTPKLNILRGLRGFTRAQGYNRSYILRYLEEMFAETFAQFKVKGINRANFVEGFNFPVTNGYVTVTKLKAEAGGLLLGPINVGGQIFNVWFSTQPPKNAKKP